IISLPRAEAVFNDYQNKKKSGACFEGTRVALLREMADWATDPDESRMYVLSGLAGIGKSTVAYTIASRAANPTLNLLGASFFFSRDEADRNNAKKFFTTIAYQLCVYDERFAKAIGDVLVTERGSAATTKDPQEQLQILILDPLRSIVQSRARPILVVVDALDECDEDDERHVVQGLSRLVRELPCFKVILTTRPQPHLDRFLCSQGGHKIFRLQDIEDMVVDGDIRRYLSHSLSLEAVQERYPHRQWSASGEEIVSLVGSAGRLFIIASTAVRYILDKSASNPAAQMQKLLHAFTRYLTPLKDLDQFYTIILRNVVPENCDNADTVSRYQSVVGAIVFVQRPLPVSTLAQLINIDVVEIREVLDNLQSVILLGSDDVPRIYHKSFPDYLTDQARCKDPHLRIDTRSCHIAIATRCFEIMDKGLKRNILGLGVPARFMSNEDGLKEDEITDEQLQEKIPQQLRYASAYWGNHLEVANIEGEALMNGLEKFVDEHMLYWFEVLSLSGNFDSAHLAIRIVLKLLKSRFSDLHQLLSDALRFIGKFYDIIKRSALHAYYSALPFTPSNSLLYHRYIKDAVDNLCSIEGGPEQWDALVANMSHEAEERVDTIKFSLDSTLFVSCSERRSKIWDAVTGMPISTITGNATGVTALALSRDCSRLACGFKDGTVELWGTSPTKRRIGPLDLRSKMEAIFFRIFRQFRHAKPVEALGFDPDGGVFASGSDDGTIKLWNGGDGELRGTLKVHGNATRVTALALSRDCSRLACGFVDGTVELWETSPTRRRIGPLALRSKMEAIFFLIFGQSHHAKSVQALGFDPDGGVFASGSWDGTIKLWNGGDGALRGTLK
ncbi:hypothetical protein M378DRAFT_52585, partial [Amanita muscaria Koide BX008]